jgi:glutamate synthase (NADPH/NADH) small chain
LKEREGSEKLWPCDLALLALGFTGHEPDLIDKLDLDTNVNNQIITHNYQTSVSNVFSAGDMRRGQSLVVWAISEGRKAAKSVDNYLMGSSSLPD